MFACAIFSGALARHNITGTAVFAVSSYVLSNPDWDPNRLTSKQPPIHLIAETTRPESAVAPVSNVGARPPFGSGLTIDTAAELHSRKKV